MASNTSAQSSDELVKAELAVFQPSDSELRHFHLIALFFLLVSLLLGLPIWWMTTRPEQFDLSNDQITTLSSRSIVVGIDVVLLVFDPWLTDTDVNILENSLRLSSKKSRDLNYANNEGSSIRLSVRYDFHFRREKDTKVDSNYSNASIDSPVSPVFEKQLFSSGLLDGENYKISSEDAYFFVILPNDFPLFVVASQTSQPVGVVRNIASKSLVYLRSPCIASPSSVDTPCKTGASLLHSSIFNLLEDHFVVPSRLQAVYDAVWWKGSDTDYLISGLNAQKNENGDSKLNSMKQELARSRTHQLPPSGVYEVTITLVSASSFGPALPVADNWLSTHTSTGYSLGDWLRLSVEPGLTDLQRYVRINLYSQYLYGISLDGLKLSQMSTDRTYRFYDTNKLSSLLNSLEAYLGHQSGEDTTGSAAVNGLHLVVVVNSPTEASSLDYPLYRPLRFQFSDNQILRTSYIAVVPQWGGFISVDNSNVTISTLGPLLTNLIRSLIGLQRPKSDFVDLGKGAGLVFFEPVSPSGEVPRWELNYWLRFRAIESLSTACLTLTSLLKLVEKVRNMVIKSHVAGWVQESVQSWGRALSLLESLSDSTSSVAPLRDAFLAAKNALEKANAAFFDHSLLDLLYFPTDQVFGIYLPLFAPIGLPIIGSSIAALKFFKKSRPKIEPPLH